MTSLRSNSHSYPIGTDLTSAPPTMNSASQGANPQDDWQASTLGFDFLEKQAAYNEHPLYVAG